MNILIVHNYYQIPGGEDAVVKAEMDMLQRHGHKVKLYTRSNKEWQDFSLWQKLLAVPRTIYSSKTYREIKRLLREERVDVVHVHNTLSMVSPSVYYAALRAGVPVVQTVHNFRLICPGAKLERDGKICEDCLKKGLSCALKHKCYRESFLQTLLSTLLLAYHRCRGIYGKIHYICLTEFNKTKLLEANQRVGKQIFDPAKIHVRGNCVEKYEAAAGADGGAAGKTGTAESQHMTAVNDPYYIYAGRLDETKGIRTLLAAWEQYKKGGGDHQLLICGEGPLSSWCQESVAEKSLAGVRLLGLVEKSKLLRLLSGAEAMIVPSQWYEGFPMSIAESYSANTPVIVSNLGNAGALVEEGKTGLHFTPGDAAALVEALQHFEESDIPWRENVKAHFEQHFDMEESYRALMKIYEDAINAKV